MKVPPSVNIVVLTVAATAFYTMVGQLVPQKEVPAPEVIEISKDTSIEEMIEIGRGIAQGKGICLTCHTLGRTGALRFPDLEGIGLRAATRDPALTDLGYLVQSLYEPDAYVVEGFNPGMPIINKAPIGLTDDEILTVIAYLQSLGGVPSVTMETRHAYNGGGEEGVSQVAVDAGQEATGTAQGTAVLSGDDLFERYGCAECHSTAPPGATAGESPPPLSVHDVGTRLDRNAILASILDPDNIPTLSGTAGEEKKAAMKRAGVYNKATLEEIQAIAEFLASQKGEG